MAPRRRRVRALGGRERPAPASRRRRRPGGLLGDGRAQVAERPLRLRDRALRRPGRAPARDERDRRVPDPGRRHRGTRADGVHARSSRGARARFRSTRRSATLGRDGSRASSSSAAASTRAPSPSGSRELPGCEVLNEVVLNQVLFRFADDATTTAALGGGAGRRRGVDERHDLGRAARDPAVRLGVADDGGRHRADGRGVRAALARRLQVSD